MKKILISILLATVTLCRNTSLVCASNVQPLADIIYVSDDLYYEITISSETENISRATAQTKNCTKTFTLKNSDDEVLFRFYLYGTFTYNGSSSTCTKVSYDTVIYADSWGFEDISTSKSGNTASATFTAHKTFLFIELQSVTKTLTLTCDANGNVS